MEKLFFIEAMNVRIEETIELEKLKMKIMMKVIMASR